MRHPSFAIFANARRGNPLILAAALFALGLAAGATVRPAMTIPGAASVEPALAAVGASEPAPVDIPLAHRLDPSIVYPIDVIRIIDGDTFEARVRVWPGLDVDTKVRLRGVDAAELHARCAGELEQAQAARVALEKNIGRRRRDDFARRRRQIWWAGRRHDRDARHRRRVGGAAQWRLCARLRRRQARLVVRMTEVSNQLSVIRRTDDASGSVSLITDY